MLLILHALPKQLRPAMSWTLLDLWRCPDVSTRSFTSCKSQGGDAADQTCSSTSPDTLLLVCCLSLLRSLSVGTHHCWAGAPHEPCCSGDAPTQPSRLAITTWTVRIFQVFTLAHFSHLQHVDYKNWLFTKRLIHTRRWHGPLLRDKR